MASISLVGDNLLFEGEVVANVIVPEGSFRERFKERLENYVREMEPNEAKDVKLEV